jgi:hypothetical protein
MPISRGMMERQLRMGGGIMNIVPREEAFLGGLKKAIKGVAKGIGSFIKSDAGKMALTAGALYGLGGGTFFGKSLPGIAGTGFKAGNILSNIKNMPFLGKAVGALGLSALTGGMPQPEVGSIGSNPSAIRSYLREYFTNLNPQRDNEEDEEYEARINQLVESNMVEYMSDGGRIGFFLGGNFQQSEKQAQRDRDISRKEAARPDDSGPSTPPPSVLARKPKVNIPTPDKSDDRGILATVGDYFSNLPNPFFTPVAADEPTDQELIEKARKQKGKEKELFTIADDTVAKGIGTGDILTSVPDLTDPTVMSNIAKTLDLPTEKKKFKLGTEMFGKTKLDYPKPEVERAIKSIQNLKRLTDDTGKEIGVSVEDVMDFGSPSLKNLTEEQIRSIYDMVEADQDSPIFAAEGGRIGYARGDSAEDNAMQAAGVMGLPLNQNPAGITELDLRETGGFIPPVGVKEKADDIPAMLSNNEFVFTADAVRGMGDGDVNKGAQRMYDMMKRLENGGRV